MLDWLWSNNPKDEWATWEEWQKLQPPIHYEKSVIYEYFIYYEPNFIPPVNSVVTEANKYLYWYCFGQFTPFIATRYNGGGNIIEYILLLLKLYDTCKGLSRKIAGDPKCISLLRNVIKKRSISELREHNFSQYNYDYTKLHAHTVVQYSLSTLIMKFIANYIGSMEYQKNIPIIQLENCRKAYNNYLFGDHPREPNYKPAPSIAIDISTSSKSSQEHRNFSWPEDRSTIIKCNICKRACENLWGEYKVCLDCHTSRVCSKCGGNSIIIASDGLPRCFLHSNFT